jgi:hypothetical protein
VFIASKLRFTLRRAWRCQRGNQNPQREEGQTTQWPKQKEYTHKAKDRVPRTTIKTGGVLRCSWRVSSPCSTSGTRRVNLVTNPMISHELGMNPWVLTTSGTYPWSFVTQIYTITVNQFIVVTVKLPKWWIQLKYSKTCTYCCLSQFKGPLSHTVMVFVH